MKKWILQIGIALWLVCSVYTLVVSFLPGPQGIQGLPGIQGVAGEKGSIGETGCKGPRGMKGATGYVGVTGSQGEKGKRGDIGPRGEKGDTWYNDLPKLYRQTSPAVVWIGAEDEWSGEQKWCGTGFFVTPNLIATAGHVCENTEFFEVMFSDGTRAKADFVHAENLDRCDVGFIRLRSEYRKDRPYLDLDTEVDIGEDLIIVGYPFGLNYGPTLTKGVMSLLQRSELFFGTKLVMHTDTAAWFGNSGSPVIDMDGECVGIYIGLRVGYDNFSIVAPAKLVELAMQKALAEIGLKECR